MTSTQFCDPQNHILDPFAILFPSGYFIEKPFGCVGIGVVIHPVFIIGLRIYQFIIY